jgi:hypothetical protein
MATRTMAIVLRVERGSAKKSPIHFQTLKTNSDETVAFFPIGQVSAKLLYVERGMSNNQRHFTEPFLS